MSTPESTPTRLPRVSDEGASEQPEHHPTYHVTGRHGCWATCLCGWKSATWREQNGAQLDFGQHLLMSTTTDPASDRPRDWRDRMSPTVILTIILTIVALRPFFELPETQAKTRAAHKAGYRPNPAHSCAYLLLLPVLLGLWWWYALTTGQVLLGVIPSVGTGVAILAMVVDNAAAKARA